VEFQNILKSGKKTSKKWGRNWGKNEQKTSKNEQKKRAKNRDFVVPFFAKTTLKICHFSQKKAPKKGTEKRIQKKDPKKGTLRTIFLPKVF